MHILMDVILLSPYRPVKANQNDSMTTGVNKHVQGGVCNEVISPSV